MNVPVIEKLLTFPAMAEVVSVFLTAALMYVAVDFLRHGPLDKKWKQWRSNRKQRKPDNKAEEKDKKEDTGGRKRDSRG